MLDSDFTSQNVFTKECIFTSLMILMQEKIFHQISITEIAQKAGVSRMAYYRNYQSKEDIITTYLDEIFDEFILTVQSNSHFNQHFGLTLFFSACKQNELLITNLINHDLTHLLSDRLNLYLSLLIQHLFSQNGVNQKATLYLSEYLCGGLCKVGMKWVKNGMKESDEEMVVIISKLSRPLENLVIDD